jgi:hypothetical protein
MIKICLWPDGMWCYRDELPDYSWASDDYEVIEVPKYVNNVGLWVSALIDAEKKGGWKR